MQPETFIPGGRRVPRPRTVQTCSACGEALVTSYATCSTCQAALDLYWQADWQALLVAETIPAGSPEEGELARLVVAEVTSGEGQLRYPWTVVDWAMSLLVCGECGSELGSHYPSCRECGLAFGASIVAEVEATANEHALHIGRYVLRFPQVHSTHAVRAWQLSLPRILTGWLPNTPGAQRVMGLIKAGRWEEVRAAIRKVDQDILRRSQEADDRS